MLEKPNFPDEKIAACLQENYGIAAGQVTFLPLGADQNTAVYRVTSKAGTAYFCKLRSGALDEASVTLPKFFAEQGIAEIIAPLVNTAGDLTTHLDKYRVVVYPFIEGRTEFQVALTDEQWIQLGRTLKRIHTIQLPPALKASIQRENFSARWRDVLRNFMAQIESNTFDDALMIATAEFLQSKCAAILELLERTERLAQNLQAQSPAFVLCHTDLHGNNLLIVSDTEFYIVDWDAPIFAPQERDLMFIGANFLGDWRTAQEEEELFYRGYGATQIDAVAMAYYRYERIIEDLAVECEAIFLKTLGDIDRELEFKHMQVNFEPNQTIEIANATYSAGYTNRKS